MFMLNKISESESESESETDLRGPHIVCDETHPRGPPYGK